jgi:hypothetical protein
MISRALRLQTVSVPFPTTRLANSCQSIDNMLARKLPEYKHYILSEEEKEELETVKEILQVNVVVTRCLTNWF